jgi:50S ribosomal protein L16 3-hydroxylase
MRCGLAAAVGGLNEALLAKATAALRTDWTRAQHDGGSRDCDRRCHRAEFSGRSSLANPPCESTELAGRSNSLLGEGYAMLRPGLDALIDPIRREKFFAEYWRAQHLLIQKGGINLGNWWGKLASMSIPEILDIAEDPVIVMHTTRDGEYRATRVRTSEAYGFYGIGMGLYFNLASSLDDVRQWTERLADDLGHLGSKCMPSVFITPAGWTTELHFDPNENFTLQLRGSKIWNLTRNASVPNPVDRFTASGSVSERMEQYYTGADLLDDYIRADLPNHDNNSTVEMTPGSVLYVPRGYWHSVESVGESVSINLAIIPETWASFLLLVLPRLLLTSPELREVATGITGSAELRSTGCRGLHKALEIASARLSAVCVEDLIPDSRAGLELTTNMPTSTELIQRNWLAGVSMQREGPSTQRLSVTIGGFTSPGTSFSASGNSGQSSTYPVKRTALTLDEIQCRLAAWLLPRDSFCIKDILQEFGDVEPEVVTEFIAAIIQTGLFRAVTATAVYRD